MECANLEQKSFGKYECHDEEYLVQQKLFLAVELLLLTKKSSDSVTLQSHVRLHHRLSPTVAFNKVTVYLYIFNLCLLSLVYGAWNMCHIAMSFMSKLER